MKNESVLITGAASGIGLELARQFARHGHDLILTARSDAELEAIATDFIAEHGVKVKFIAADLKRPEAPQEIYNALKAEGIVVEILVNNAGFGQKGKFWQSSLDRDVEMIRVNVEAVVRFTRLFLPDMVARGSGRVLNTASIAGFMPGPLMSVYHATKAFVLSFSEAISTELKDTGVTVTALCPGATDTDFFPEADAVEARIFQKGNLMAPQDVAEGGYEAVMRGDRVYIAGGVNKAMVFSRKFAPESLLSKINEVFYTDVKPEDHQREPGEVAAKASERF